MVGFENFRPRDGVPVYQQILEHIKEGIASGCIVDGDELPSRRTLSTLLGLNPNTVQKAYKILEDEGIIESHAGAKSYVRLDGEKTAKIKAQLIEAAAVRAAEALKRLGLDQSEAVALIQKYW